MPRKQPPRFDFETSIEQLETIVNEMETGELSLEAAMQQFEKGVQLTQQCHKTLEQAEQKVKILLEKQGKFTLTDFASEELDDADDESETDDER